MDLSVRDRLILLSIIPQEGDFLTLKITRKLRESLSFSEEEHKLYKFVEAEGAISWDNSAEQVKVIPLGDKAREIIADSLRKLDKQKKLKMEHLDLYERFVEGKEVLSAET